jgi:hypothetical protein
MFTRVNEETIDTNARPRMLENPSDESVVRWGNDGDSFVVLEVCCRKSLRLEKIL